MLRILCVLQGMCTRGDKCKYSHDVATIVNFNSKEKGICFDYLRNQCSRGLLCRFSHDLSNIAQQCQVGHPYESNAYPLSEFLTRQMKPYVDCSFTNRLPPAGVQRRQQPQP